MRRRALLAAALSLAPVFRVIAQQRRVIAYLAARRTDHLLDAWLHGMRDAGWEDGRNISVLFGFQAETGRSPAALVSAALEANAEVIVVTGNALAQAAKSATSTVPIVFAPVGDPVANGLVSRLASHGTNMTGVGLMGSELNVKRLDFLRQAFPAIRRILVVLNSNNPSQPRYGEEVRRDAERAGLSVTQVFAAGPQDVGNAIASQDRAAFDAIIVASDSEFDAGRRQMIPAIAAIRVPAIYEHRAFVEAGGLLSYGPDIDSMSRRAASFVDRLLKGAKATDLPVEQPSSFELVLNQKAAQAAGIIFPDLILAAADHIIE